MGEHRGDSFDSQQRENSAENVRRSRSNFPDSDESPEAVVPSSGILVCIRVILSERDQALVSNSSSRHVLFETSRCGDKPILKRCVPYLGSIDGGSGGDQCVDERADS